MIRYLVGDATAPRGDGPKLIVHVCNDVGKWGKGFVLAISRRWKSPEQRFKAQKLALGDVQIVEVEPELWVANVIGQHGVASKRSSAPPIRYDAIRTGLARVREQAAQRHASVHMPRIGCGLAGGRWDEIEPIVAAELHGVDVTVYDVA